MKNIEPVRLLALTFGLATALCATACRGAPPATEPAAPEGVAPVATAPVVATPAPQWNGDRLVYATNGWALTITYLNKGTRSEGQNGVLERDGQPVPAEAKDAQLETPLGTLKYYGTERPTLWSVSGWNFADRKLIKGSHVVAPPPAP